MVVLYRRVKRRQPHGVRLVRSRAGRQQQRHRGQLTPVRGAIQRGNPVRSLGVDIRMVMDQNGDCGCMALLGGGVERRPAALDTVVRIRASAQERVGGGGVAEGAGLVEGRNSAMAGDAGISSRGDKQRDDVLEAVQGGRVERSRAVLY